MADWPDAKKLKADHELVATMDKVRDICSVAKAIREEKGLRNRLPLASMTVAGEGLSQLQDFFGLIEDEVNIKEIRLVDDLSEYAERFLYIFTPKVGKRLGKHMKAVIAASKTND